jgi:molecular chaperone GrpE
MDPKEQIPMPEESLDAMEVDTAASVDDFIKQLEAKEKDLHITSDLTIEVEESEFDERNIPDDILPPDLGTSSQEMGDPGPKAKGTGNKTRLFELEQELESLKKRLATLREERNEVQEKSDRRLKDFESYRYRMDRERRGAFIDQIANLASQMLPVFDNLDRGLDSVRSAEGERSAEFQQFYDGIVLVNQQMAEIFQSMGVESIATVGQPFDPTFHEAVAVEEGSELPPNTVTEEMLRGYRIGNRVVRHSMVKVTTGGTRTVDEEPTTHQAASSSMDEPAGKLLEPTDIDGLFEELPDNK